MNLGEHAHELRRSKALTQKAAADKLGITNVHLCNIENDVSIPSPDLLERMSELYGVDLYVYAWCQSGDVERLPGAIREAAAKLTKAWKVHIAVNARK